MVPRHGARVMLVDDDPVVLEVTRAWLEDAAFDVIVRERAIGTRAAIEEQKPDVVLLDVGMPGITGGALVSFIQYQKPTHPFGIVLYSSCNLPELTALAERCGTWGAIRKTGDRAEFMREFLRIITPHMRETTP